MNDISLNNMFARYTGSLLIVAGLVANPYFIGFYIINGSIDSTDVNSAIILLELAIIASGILVIWRKPTSSANIAISITVLFLCLFLAEIISVATNIFTPHDYVERHKIFHGLLHPDDELGYRPRSNLTDYRLSWMKGGLTCVCSTDKYGFRNVGKDYSNAEKYFVGDSFVFGAWVDRNEAFYGIIEHTLQEPVITLGVLGYGFKQYVTLMNNFVLRYRPETTVLGIFANDLGKIPSESYFKDYYNKSGWNRYRNELPSYRDKSLIGQVIRMASSMHASYNRKKLKNGLTLGERGEASANYIAASEYVAVERAFLDIINLAKRSNSRLVVVLFPSKESAYKDEYLKLYPGNYLYNEEEGYARICRLADEQGIECVDLTPVFRDHAGKGEKLYFDEDGHWNELGNKVVADAILPYLTN